MQNHPTASSLSRVNSFGKGAFVTHRELAASWELSQEITFPQQGHIDAQVVRFYLN